MKDIFGGVLDIIEGVVDIGLDIHRGHDGSDTQVTDYGSDGLNFVIDVLKGVTKFVGSSRDREIILQVIEGLDTTGRKCLHDAARIESRDETTGITIYILDGLRLYGNLHMGIAENVLNKPAEKSNAAFLINIVKNGCDILNDIWDQDIEKVATASATCNDMCGSLKVKLRCIHHFVCYFIGFTDFSLFQGVEYTPGRAQNATRCSIGGVGRRKEEIDGSL